MQNRRICKLDKISFPELKCRANVLNTSIAEVLAGQSQLKPVKSVNTKDCIILEKCVFWRSWAEHLKRLLSTSWHSSGTECEFDRDWCKHKPLNWRKLLTLYGDTHRTALISCKMDRRLQLLDSTAPTHLKLSQVI